MKFKKADEMEMYINMQSTKWAYFFVSTAMFIWMGLEFFKTGDFPNIPFIIHTLSGVIYWTSNLYYRKKLIGEGEKDGE